jgi:hypothetical protein
VGLHLSNKELDPMASFDLSPIGRVDFPNNADGCWEFSLSRADRSVLVDFNVDGDEMTKQGFDLVKQFVEQADAFESAARKAIEADFSSDPDSSSALYLSHHAEYLDDEERLEYFGTKDTGALGVEHLLSSLHLRRIGLYPDSEDYVAIFDYSLDPDATQYILAVEFDSSGRVVGISMES